MMWLLITVFVECIVFINAKCDISVKSDLNDKSPIIVDQSWTHFIMPNDSGIISLQDNESVKMSCPGGNLVINGDTQFKSEANATCYSGKFNILGKLVRMLELNCSRKSKAEVRYTNNLCLTRFKELEIGFPLNSQFISIMKICFDDINLTTLYSKNHLPKEMCKVPKVSRIPFTDEFFNSVNLSIVYSKIFQTITINNILGLDPNSDKYVKKSGNFYLAKGHLAAMADYIFAAQQRGTFKSVNVLPQWQTLNNCNWKSLEAEIKYHACNTSQGLDVYTGGFGIMTLPHEKTGIQQKIYLYNKKIPVPKYFWKVIHDPDTRLSVAFIALNNPYNGDTSEINCPNICSTITWLKWQPFNQLKGLATCCKVSEARKIIPNIPDF